jgi:DNA-directed RNA polymerase subunit E'
MFKLSKVEDVVRIHPEMFGQDLTDVATAYLKEKYENTYDEEIGYIVLVDNVDVEPEGKVLSWDGSSFHKVRFDVTALRPMVNEIVEGEVVEIATFGVFVRIGSLDALLHISQIMNDFVTVDPSRGVVLGKESNRVLRVGDKVRVRIVAVSPPKGVSVGKIGLTCRQPFLGKLEWIEEDVAKARGEGS